MGSVHLLVNLIRQQVCDTLGEGVHRNASGPEGECGWDLMFDRFASLWILDGILDRLGRNFLYPTLIRVRGLAE